MVNKQKVILFVLLILIKESLADCTKKDTLRVGTILDEIRNAIMINLDNPINCSGYIKAWKWIPSVSVNFTGLVWRPTDTVKEYELIGRTMLPAVDELNKTYTHSLSRSVWIPVEAGDVIGFYFDQALLIYEDDENLQIEYASNIVKEDLRIGSFHTVSTEFGRRYPIMAISEEFIDRRSVVERKHQRSSIIKKTEIGFTLPGHIIHSFKSPSVVRCIVSCQKDQLCQSVSYDTLRSVCHLNCAKQEDTNNIEVVDDVVYYEFIDKEYYGKCEDEYHHGHSGLDTHVCFCDNGDCKSEWNLIFKGMSGTGVSIVESFVDGTQTSESEASKSFDSSENFRLNKLFENWTSSNIIQVKLTLYSKCYDELIHLTFNGITTTKTSWFSIEHLLDSPWDDLKSGVEMNYFSIAGNFRKRVFFVNKHYGGCSNDKGWLVVIDDTSHGCEWEQIIPTPAFLFSSSDEAETLNSGSVSNEAYIMTVHVKYG
ncbi:uncharacterized protein [Antedon mediterranea]|uniref:uncharacterized protein n=1 Tax=Antedon mediterranea TaxID=105859 RepID=UPI003AF8A5D8